MKFVAVVFSPDGAPLPRAEVDVVVPKATGLASAGRGTVVDGALTANAARPGSIWGLLIDNKPVLAFPASFSVEDATVDLGEINLLADGAAGVAFHAPDGKLFGVPFFERPGAKPGEPARATLAGDTGTIKTGLTFGGMVGSTAEQLSAATTVPSGFNLTGASISVKGVPTVVENAIGLEFPSAELAATGAGLSELTFTMKPPAQTTAPSVEEQPTGPRLPDLSGYTRDLATRKLAALGLHADVSSVIVQQPSQEGRVVRQIPAALTIAPAGSVVRLFVGKRGGA